MKIKTDRPPITRFLFTLALFLTVAAAVPGQTFQLRDGSILVGEIQGLPSGEGFTLKRTDTGGVLDLRWSHLAESSAKLVKTEYGLLNTDDEDVKVRADVVTYESSPGHREEAVGRIVKRTATEIHVRRKGDITPIRRKTIVGLGERQVTPHEIFTTDDYYNDLVAEFAPGEDADKHLLLGEQLLNVRDYGHAELHMKKAVDLGGGRQPLVLKKRLDHLQLLKGAAAEQKLLDDIRTSTNRGSFAVAEAKIAEFKEKFTDSKLVGDLARLEKKYRKVREAKLVVRTAKLWYKHVTLLANRKASDQKATLQMARQYAEREMGKEIRGLIAEKLSIEVDEVEEFWGKRFAVSGAAAGQHYHYSLGSWLLGEKGVLKETKQGRAEAQEADKGKSGKQKEVEKGVKRIQEALKRARAAAQRRANRGKKSKEETPEDWWLAADRHARTSWLKAYYAEFGSDMKLTGAYLSVCPTCAGAGRLATQGTTGGVQYQDCPTCHRTRFKRDIRAK